jgi:hypothetical protein
MQKRLGHAGGGETLGTVFRLGLALIILRLYRRGGYFEPIDTTQRVLGPVKGKSYVKYFELSAVANSQRERGWMHPKKAWIKRIDEGEDL